MRAIGVRMIRLTRRSIISGSHPSYFLLIVERLLVELRAYFGQGTSCSPAYGALLVDVLQRLISTSDSSRREQIIHNDSVRGHFHALLYTCLAIPNHNHGLAMRLWNIYGRII